MKKTIRICLLINLILFLVILNKFLLIEEIIGFYLLPMILVSIISGILYLIIKLFKKRSYKNYLNITLLIACFSQLMLFGLILRSATPIYFAREKVIADIDYAIKIMENIHPNLYHSISKNEFSKKCESLKILLPEKVSAIYINRLLHNITSMVRDGHTYVYNPYDYQYYNYLFRKILPYRLSIKNDKMFVVENYCYRKEIPIGSEIITMNGKSTKECINEVSHLLSFENEPYRNSLLEGQGIWSLWNNYEFFKIIYKDLNTNKLHTITSAGGFLSNKLQFSRLISPGIDFRFKTLTNNVCLMEIGGFSNYDLFSQFLDSTFRYIQKARIPNLIIDLRKNEGGDSHLVDELMQYISNCNFCMFDSANVRVSNELVADGNLNWITPGKRIVGTMVADTIETSKIKLRNNPLRYQGQLFLLIGSSTFSSASGLASEIKCYNRGKLIGEETGGVTACFGDIYKFKLPNTEFKIIVSKKKYYNACGVDDNRGVVPDFIVENSFEDERKEIDRVLEFTIALINKK